MCRQRLSQTPLLSKTVGRKCSETFASTSSEAGLWLKGRRQSFPCCLARQDMVSQQRGCFCHNCQAVFKTFLLLGVSQALTSLCRLGSIAACQGFFCNAGKLDTDLATPMVPWHHNRREKGTGNHFHLHVCMASERTCAHGQEIRNS